MAGSASYLEMSRRLYRDFIAPMIHFEFSSYESCIAAGLIGEGSECFGYEDAISADHDYVPGLCLFLDQETFSVIGNELARRYEEVTAGAAEALDLPVSAYPTPGLKARRGVFEISRFFADLLGTTPERVKAWMAGEAGGSPGCVSESVTGFAPESVPEERLSAAVNGEIFRDDQGLVTGLRRTIAAYYPEPLRLKYLAEELHRFSQNAQYNYPRMMARGDLCAASLHRSAGIESALRAAYILKKRYRPHLKWLRRGLDDLDGFEELGRILDEAAGIGLAELSGKVWPDVTYDPRLVAEADPVVRLFERAAEILAGETEAQGIIEPGSGSFLDLTARQVLKALKKPEAGDDRTEEKKALIDEIISLEWPMFQNVRNEGGRASCQDNYRTFDVMRRSQFLTWDEAVLKSYRLDLMEAAHKGRNLLTEKYAHMMASTAPLQYEAIRDRLPEISPDRRKRQEEIIRLYVGWMEELQKQYPGLAGRERVVHTSEDTVYRTSFETYLRGEMTTYSDRTFDLLEAMILKAEKTGRNPAVETLRHEAGLYGYRSLEEAEKAVLCPRGY